MKRVELKFKLTRLAGKVDSVALCALAGLLISSPFSHAAPFVLEGDHIRIGVNDIGTLGSGGSTPPGILYKDSSSAAFNPAYDYLTPGSPFEGFTVTGKNASSVAFTASNNNAPGHGANVAGTITNYSGVAYAGSTYDNRAVWSGSYTAGGAVFSVVNDIFFNDSSKQINIKTTITANQNLTDIYFGRFIDPDAQAAAGDSSSTNNIRGSVGVAANDLVYAEALVSKYVIGLYSNDATAHGTGITGPWSKDPSSYFNGINAGNGDNAIGMGFFLGSLSAGASKSFSYAYIFGSSIADSIATVSKPNIDTSKSSFTTTELSSSQVNPIFDGGTLKISDSGTVSANFTITNAGGSINTNGNTGIFSGAIADSLGNSGSLTIKGAGTTILSGVNTYSGGTMIKDGATLSIAADSALGARNGKLTLNDGTLTTTTTQTSARDITLAARGTFNIAANTTLTNTGTINSAAATGCFIKSGSGTLNLTGNATLNSGTCVQDGELRANGILTSTVDVESKGKLRGSGNLVGQLNVKGTLAPGNSPGILNQVGTTNMLSGSVFQSDIDGTGTGNGAGNYSRFHIANGQFVIGSAVTLNPTLRGITGSANNTFTPQMGDQFRVITADGGIVGNFSAITQPMTGLLPNSQFTAFYNTAGSNSVDLVITPTSYVALLQGGSHNTISASHAIDELLKLQNSSNANPQRNELLHKIAISADSAIPSILQGLSGEIHGAVAAAAPQAGQALQSKITDHLRMKAAEKSSSENVEQDHSKDLWINISTNRSNFAADEYASDNETRLTLYTLGWDAYKNGNSKFGIGLAYANNDVKSKTSSGSDNSSLAIVYGQFDLGSAVIDAMGVHGINRWKTERTDPLQANTRLSSTATGSETHLSAGIRFPQKLGEQTIEPFARAMWQRVARNSTNEGSLSSARLALDDYSATGTRLLVGISGESSAKNPLADRFTYRYSIAAGHDGAKANRPSVDAKLLDQDFEIVAPHSSRGFMAVTVNGTMQLTNHSYAYAGISGEVGKDRHQYGLNAGVNVSFR